MNNCYIRFIESSDYLNGYLDLLSQLTKVDAQNITYNKFSNFVKNLNDNHIVLVVEDTKTHKLVGSGTCFIEQKIIHGLSRVAHIEDIVVDVDYRSRGIGKFLVEKLIKYAEDVGCYKVILNCDEKNVSFYEKCGFTKKEVEMVIYFDGH